MNQEQRLAIGKMWLALAGMYGREIDQLALKIMLDAISDLDHKKVAQAMMDWTRTSKQNRHPLPADIRSMVNPELDKEAEAREASSRVTSAISKFGWNNPEDAKKFVGTLGWHIVERFGGWNYICQNIGVTIDLTTFQAQAREIAKATLIRGPTGLSTAPSLPQADERLAQILSGNNMNKIISGGNDGTK